MSFAALTSSSRPTGIVTGARWSESGSRPACAASSIIASQNRSSVSGDSLSVGSIMALVSVVVALAIPGYGVTGAILISLVVFGLLAILADKVGLPRVDTGLWGGMTVTFLISAVGIVCFLHSGDRKTAVSPETLEALKNTAEAISTELGWHG